MTEAIVERNALWMIINNLTEEKTIPDFRRFSSRTDLEKITPDSVSFR
jgi:hypothetical protein